MASLLISIDGAGASPAELDELARGLRQDLLELPVTDVRPASAGEAPPGSRGVDASSIGDLVVVLNSSATLLVSVVAAVRSWRRHTIPDGSVRLRLGEDEIEVSSPTEETEARLLDDWARRHGG
jgi:hypothetical protein